MFLFGCAKAIRYLGLLLLLIAIPASIAVAAAEPPVAAAPLDTSGKILHAGKINLKLQDGQLRYIRVGNREIIRRIYFGVREANFATDLPKFTEYRVDSEADHFAIHVAASCQGPTLSYDWSADITGSADGVVKYTVTGSAPSDGTSKRIGLCVLYGADSLVGKSFETLNAQDKISPGKFPEFVSPTLVAANFHTLRYTLDGLQVSCGIAESPFEMEDQRTFGDSSFKAYNPLPYPYPAVAKGKALTQTLTLAVEGTAPPTTAPADSTVHVRIGKPIEGVRICALTSPDRFTDAKSFGEINGKAKSVADATAIAWTYTPAIHLPDDDLAMENLTTIPMQARSIRNIAPRALLRVGPISINGRWPTQVRAPHFAAAWTAGMIQRLSLGKVDEATFAESTPEAAKVIAIFKELTGKPMVEAMANPAGEISAFGVNEIGSTTLWLINRTNEPRKVTVDGLPPDATVRLELADKPSPLGGNHVELSPYEICTITFPR